MSTARNGDVDIYYEQFGDRARPTLLLVNGLGSQCINYAEEWCNLFCAEGFSVVRFDNRDVGLSSKLAGVDYTLADMADDAIAVLDDLGVDRAHVMGCSMGGMIVQRLAIDHPDRLLSMTSVMSRTGEAGYGGSSDEALAFLLAPPAESRSAYIDSHVAALHVYGSKPEWLDDDAIRARSALAYDRCFCPKGVGRQMRAVGHDGSRDDQLAAVAVPTLVIHGSRDTLIDPSGGRRTAELIPGARYHEIEGMGHDYPPAVWDEWVGVWSDFVETAASDRATG
jgi:pimeloyl-ACP methyl ester carboxylesterase